ncbi:MAG TPA: DEAD/DEAH box helicase family protein [Solirubrobacteraceae bacterium]|nr:DEAD/DEAH box helicase family protein [Solirubrobacteraceae bacterium]
MPPASSALRRSSTASPAAGSGALRAWQQRTLAAMESWQSGTFLISAAPGAGKTRPALEFARRELARRACDAVVIACPTAPLTRQWARAAHGVGLDLVPDAESPRPPAGFHGVVVTYARIAKAARQWAAGAGPRTLVVADEAHHLGEELAWGDSFNAAFAQADRWLFLSGTPFRSDATPIPGVSYDADGLAEPDFAYSYADAVRDRICRPVAFVTYDGTLSWRSGEDVIESSFDTVLSAREASRRYRTAISTELPDGLPRILREADERLRGLRSGGHADAAGLVIAADSTHARRIAALLREATGRVPVVVLHAEPRAAAKLSAFTHDRAPWIVAVNMVSEGVDIPRLRVGVYATAAKTPLVFRQIVGRFVRTLPGRPPEPSWLYIPADPVLRHHAAGIEHELRAVLRRRGEEVALDELERPDRRETEPSAGLDFEPLLADVAPQMTLFGSAPATAPVAQVLPDDPDPLPAERPVPAFERRNRLRNERHRLVSEVARRDNSSHREVNAWVNRSLGVTSVEKATLDQLERSVELLVRRLSPRR